MSRVLITGGAGFIGTNLARHLLENDYSVCVFDNLSRKGVEWNVQHALDEPGLTSFNPDHYAVVRGDVRCPEDFERIPGHIDAIVHLAANPGIPWSMSWPAYDFDVNARGTLNVLEFARTHGKIPVVYASTNKVYSDAVNEIPLEVSGSRYVYADKRQGIDETFPVDGQGSPHSPYGCSKYAGDVYCQEYSAAFDVPTVVLRMSCQYGEYQMGCEDQGWVAWFVRAHILGLGLTIYGDGKQVRDLLYVKDLVKVYELMVRSLIGGYKIHRGKVYNIGGGSSAGYSASLLEVLWLLDEIGKTYKRICPPITFKPWRLADHRVFICDIGKISKYWLPAVQVREGLTRVYEWSIRHEDVLRAL